jgi:DNA modification methylase
MDELGITKYAFLANYFNSVIRSPYKNTYEIFTTGSEIIDKDRRFHKYKGQIDFIFTSPPYFAAEAYSEDESQSYKKFDNYAAWRDGFLRRTLEIAVEYLKRKRYLCWNIADVALGGKMLPMENDTREILEDLGMEYKGLYKMALKATTATHKLKHSMPTTRNFCNVNGVFKKYEPVFVFWKK